MSECFLTKIYKKLLTKAKTELKCPSWAQYQLINIIEYYKLGTLEDKEYIEYWSNYSPDINTLLTKIECKTPNQELALITNLFRLTNLDDNEIDHQIRIIYAFWKSYIDKLPDYQEFITESLNYIPDNYLKRTMIEILAITMLHDDLDILLQYPAPAIIDLIDVIDRLDEMLIFELAGDDSDIFENVLFKIKPEQIINITYNEDLNQKVIKKIKLTEQLKNIIIQNRNQNISPVIQFKRH